MPKRAEIECLYFEQFCNVDAEVLEEAAPQKGEYESQYESKYELKKSCLLHINRITPLNVFVGKHCYHLPLCLISKHFLIKAYYTFLVLASFVFDDKI